MTTSESIAIVRPEAELRLATAAVLDKPASPDTSAAAIAIASITRTEPGTSTGPKMGIRTVAPATRAASSSTEASQAR